MAKPSEMTTVELLRGAARELVNCEATSDANADEQLNLATALRFRADRLEADIAFWCGRGCGDTTPWDALSRINAPDGGTDR